MPDIMVTTKPRWEGEKHHPKRGSVSEWLWLKSPCRHENIGDLVCYCLMHNPYLGTKWLIGRCLQCGITILDGTVRYCRPSEQAFRVLNDELAKSGRRPIVGFNNGYGSAWMCEMPVAVSMEIDAHGEEAARTFIRTQIGNPNGCQTAIELVTEATR